MGMIIGIAVQTAMLAIMTCTTDWDKQVDLRIVFIVETVVSTYHSSSSSSSSSSAGVPGSETNQPEVCGRRNYSSLV